MLKLKSAAGKEYTITYEKDVIVVNGKVYSPDIAQITGTQFHLLLGHVSYNAVVLKNDDNKSISLEVNGNSYAIEVKDQYALLLEELGMANILINTVENIKAPMPGLVVTVLVSPGEKVEKNTPLLILEAMKMENVIKSPTPAIIDKIMVNPKDAVEKNQVLITFARQH